MNPNRSTDPDRITDASAGDSNNGDAADIQRKRGVKRGTKRGAYKRTGEERARVLAAFDEWRDWRAVAEANGVSCSTAYGWIRRGDEPPKPRGGVRHRKITELHVDQLLSYREENPQITLKELAERLLADTGVRVSATTLHKHLDGRHSASKNRRAKSAKMNSKED